ncbi:MAG: hypothetical protein R3F17_10275 [Planctomycetota bacterium]
MAWAVLGALLMTWAVVWFCGAAWIEPTGWAGGLLFLSNFALHVCGILHAWIPWLWGILALSAWFFAPWPWIRKLGAGLMFVIVWTWATISTSLPLRIAFSASRGAMEQLFDSGRDLESVQDERVGWFLVHSAERVGTSNVIHLPDVFLSISGPAPPTKRLVWIAPPQRDALPQETQWRVALGNGWYAVVE